MTTTEIVKQKIAEGWKIAAENDIAIRFERANEYKVLPKYKAR